MSDITQAVAKQAEDKKDALSPVAVAVAAVERRLPQFQAVMPKGWDRARFTNLVAAAVKRTPQLITCFATQQGEFSVILAAINCASVGLEPNTPLREASLIPRKTKGVDECQLVIEYRGLIKLARRSGELSTIYAEVVHERDAFAYTRGLDPRIDHIPYDGDDDPGQLTHCYAVAKFKDGGIQSVVLNRRDVYGKHRARSDSWRSEKSRPYSPWTTDEEAMWRKTAIRAAEPFLPLTSEARSTYMFDGAAFTLDGDAIIPTNMDPATGEIIDIGDITHQPGDTP
jgi:recombination protein RecT